ncbi:hypothetical protein OSTOST_00485 [Ostertagia ostertagi]
MENLHSVTDVAFKIDMRDAYFAINLQRVTGTTSHFGETKFTCLPSGLATAPYVYNKLMRVVAAHFRERGIRVFNYLDDWEVFENLGLCINYAESQLVSTQELEFLEASSIVQRKVISARELAAFLGRVNFIALASPCSIYMTRRLQREVKTNADPLISESFENLITLTGETIADMLWFRDNLHAYASYPLTHIPSDITITTDASKVGWGAVCDGRGTGGR